MSVHNRTLLEMMGRLVEARYPSETDVQWFPLATAFETSPVDMEVTTKDIRLYWPTLGPPVCFKWGTASWDLRADDIRHVLRYANLSKIGPQVDFGPMLEEMGKLVYTHPLRSAFERVYLGYHNYGDLPVSGGDTVVIPKGAHIQSTHPQKGNYVAGRIYEVEVHHVLPGSTQTYHPIMSRDRSSFCKLHLRNPRVRWVGSGNYWFDADINAVGVA